MPRLVAAALFAGIISASSSPSAHAQATSSAAPRIPLVAGLVTASAVQEPGRGDYETILRISDVTGQAITYTVSGNVEDRRVSIRRQVRKQDWDHAHSWRPRYNEGDPAVYPGTTGGTLSADVLSELNATGRTSLKASIADEALSGLLAGLLGDKDGASGTLTRVETRTVPVSMIVNDVRTDLPTVHARGQIDGEALDVYILDNPAIPLVLRWSLGDTNKRMIRISYPVPSASNLEEKLNTARRAEVYGIYFDFAKASIRPESEPVLKDIADVMAKNPAWKLSVEGHTDNIGSAASNQDLSTRRAAAVRQALVDRYHVAADRLAPAGFGASRPKETNDTLEGRARNRRVELVRQPGA